ncbi:DUF6597 domain-containing transcriptional factor [Chitinophaga sp. Hz27]|uniref:DUF6597 domain-containing transcriptional factor n=1 Tax=Chitinophaga sp. Hz27 TaxID=3347169 RepID=UPI0035DE2BC6
MSSIKRKTSFFIYHTGKKSTKFTAKIILTLRKVSADMDSLGIHIRNMRENAGYSPQQFAGISHIPLPALLQMEQGQLLPSKYQLLQFAGQLSLSASPLITQHHTELIKRSQGTSCRTNALTQELQRWQQNNIILESFPVPANLQHVIESMVYYACTNHSYQSEKLLPDGFAQLILNLNNATALLIGQRDAPLLLPQESRIHRVIVRFQPDGLFACTGIPQQEILNKAIDATPLLGKEITEWMTACLHSTKWLFEQVAQFFITKLSATEALPIEAKVIRYLITNIDQPLPLLVEKSGYSQKHLIHLFRMRVGVTPKVFQQIHLFSNSIQAISLLPTARLSGYNWSESYFDQAHFNRQFSRFSGFTPTAYLNTGATCPRMVQL